MAVRIVLSLLSLSLAVSPAVPLPVDPVDPVDPGSSSSNVVIVRNEFPPPLSVERGFWDNAVNTVDTEAAKKPCLPGVAGCDSTPSSRPKRTIKGISRRRHYFFSHWTINKAPQFLHRGMIVAHVDDRLRAPFRITCLPAVDPDGSSKLLRYRISSVYPMDQPSFAIGSSSGCVYVVRDLDRWPNLHPLRVCVQDGGIPALRTCTTLLVILYSGKAQSLSTAAPLPEGTDATTASTDESTYVTTSDAASVDEFTEGPNTTEVPVPDSTNELNNSSTDSDIVTEDTATPAASVSPIDGDLTTSDTDEGRTTFDLVTPYVPIVATARSYSTTTDDAGSPQPESTDEMSSTESPAVTTEQPVSTSSDTTEKNDTTGSVSDQSTASPGSTASVSAGDNASTLSQGQTTTEATSNTQGISVVSDVTEEPQTPSSTPGAPALRFDQTTYKVSIPENLPINFRVPVSIPIKASLLGSSSGAQAEPVTYRLASPDPESAFDVDPSDATLITTKVIDREETPQINVSIAATTPSGLTATADVIVDVIDLNDNAPRFDVAAYEVNATSDVEEGGALATVEARDDDEGENGEVKYLLHGDHRSFFSLDPYTGVLTLAARLPAQAGDYRLNLTVTAVDSGLPQLETSLPLTVVVSPPSLKFTTPGPFFFAPAELPAGTQIGTVEATDEKAGNSSAVTYSLVTSHSDLMFPFTIGPQTGDLLTSAPLPRGQQYDLSVEARVDDDPPRSVVTAVTVIVESPQ